MSIATSVKACSYTAGVSICASAFFFGTPALSALAIPPTPTFGSPASFATANSPQAVAIGDVNGDGNRDMVSGNGASDNVSVLLGNGDGTFEDATTLTPFGVGVSQDVTAAQLGDVDNDGDLDIIAVSSTRDKISVMLNNGSGSFAPGVETIAGASPHSLVLGDVNGDGYIDAVATSGTFSSVALMLNSGHGTLTSPSILVTGDHPQFAALGDISHDGQVDIVTANSLDYQAPGTVSVLRNQGNGTWSAPSDYAAGSGARSVAIGDFNGDSWGDLAVANATIFTGVGVLINSGAGTFPTRNQLDIFYGSYSVAIGDINGDGFSDIAAAGPTYSNFVGFFPGEGDGTFTDLVAAEIGNNPFAIALGDLNNDGRLDVEAARTSQSFASLALNTTSYTPAISLAPTSGIATGGTRVTITGTNFTGTTSVKFGTRTAASFTVTSDTEITAVTRPGTIGTVPVTVASQIVDVSAPNAFTFTPGRSAQTLNPANVPKFLHNPGTTTLNPVGSRTRQGLPVSATVRQQARNSTRGDFVCGHSRRGPIRSLRINLSGKCALRITVTYTAPGNATYKPYRLQKTYLTKRVR